MREICLVLSGADLREDPPDGVSEGPGMMLTSAWSAEAFEALVTDPLESCNSQWFCPIPEAAET
jgi:hypothetical protein